LAHLTDPATDPFVRRIGTNAAQRAVRILSQSHPTVADAVFAGTTEQAAICCAAPKLSIGFVGLFLVAELGERVEPGRSPEDLRVRPHAGDCRTSGEI
jgi:hypothetical protein